jgi:hypothetical protein
MRKLYLAICCAAFLAGCSSEQSDPHAEWFATPDKVVEGLMYAYETRNDSLWADLLADDFRYFFEPPGADSSEVLGWGKEEEVVATRGLFTSSEVSALVLRLDAGPAVEAGQPGWMMIPVSGGEQRIEVKDKEPTHVPLNRQEIFVRPHPQDSARWQVIAWHDYPAP